MINPLISVIIPTYNRWDLIDRAIGSIRTQTIPDRDIEIIIVDDGSTKIPLDTFHSDIKYLFLPMNSGFHARPRNMGLRIAEGKYVAYLDDDDVYTPDHLETLLGPLERDDSIDFTYGRRRYIGDPKVGNIESAFFPWDNEKALMPFWLGTCDIMHKRELLFKLGGWNESLKRYGDFELGCRLGKFGAHGHAVNKVITECHTSRNQISYNKTVNALPAEEILDNLEVIQKWLNH